ncbi:MAG: transposase [Burkholderiaceae bacterium]
MAPDGSHAICPARRKLYSNGSQCMVNGRSCHKCTGSHSSCGPCGQCAQCLRYPERTPVRQVAIFRTHRPDAQEDVLEAVRQRVDCAEGRRLYSQRSGEVEPVFGNLRHNKRLSRLTLRGQRKVARSGNCIAWCTTSKKWREMG